MKQVLVVILVPLVIGIALLVIEHKVIVPSNSSPEPKAALAPLAGPTTQGVGLPAREPASTAQHTPSIHGVDASASTGIGLEAQVALAKRLYGVDPRNAAYVRIIDQAVSANDLRMALTVSEKLYGVDIRNDNYDKIITHAIKLSQLDLADQVAGRLYGVDRRNAALSRLLEARAGSK